MLIPRTIFDPIEDDNIKRLRTYYNYLRCINEFLISEYTNWQNYALFCISQALKVQGKPDLELDWINRWLKIAWNTEYLINAGPDQVELIRINNQWLPIQSYYSIYAASEAFTYAIDKNKSGSHAKARKKLTSFLSKSKIKPWNFICDGNKTNIVFTNFPNINNFPNNLSCQNVVPHEMIGTCLRAEHRHRINENFVKRRTFFKKDFNPGLTSLLYFFYRLRIKSNYRDIDLFIMDATDTLIIEFANSLKEIVFWFLLMTEVYLIRRCKKRNIVNFIEDYLSINNQHDLLRTRSQYYEDNI